MFPRPTIQSVIKSKALNSVIYYSFIFLFFSVSLVPFNILEIKIASIPVHYVYIGGFAVLLTVLSFLQNPKLTLFDKWLIFIVIGFSLSLLTSIDRIHSIRVLVGFFTKGICVAFITERIFKYNKKAIVSFLLLCASIVALFGFIELFFVWNPYFKVVPDTRIMYSTIGNPLVFGVFLIPFIPLSIWFFKESKKFLKIIPFILVVFSILFSFSRISWITLFCVIIIYFSKKESFKKLKRNWIYVIILAMLFLLPIFLVSSFRGIFSYRFNITHLKSLSFIERVEAYKITRNILKDYPLFGVGFGNYPKIYPKYKMEHNWPDLPTADNMYLRLLCDTGIIGLVTFLGFIIYWMHKLWESRDNPVVWAIFCGLVGFSINQLTADLFFWTAPQFAFWTMLGMGVGISGISDKNG